MEPVKTTPKRRRADDPIDPDALALGLKIRELRTAAGLTLEDVAGAAGVSQSLVSQVERGIAQPSIGTLRGIAAALGVPMAALFLDDGEVTANGAEQDATGRRVVVRAADRKRLHARRSGTIYELLTPDINRQVEFLWGEFEPGASAPQEKDSWAAHTGEENVLVLDGVLVFTIDGKEFELGPGDSISFDCSVPHRADNRTDRRATVVIAITPPSF